MAITVLVDSSVTEVIVQAAIPAILAGGSPAWGSISGTVSNQTDLQTELDATLKKTAEITNLEVVAALPGTPDPTTLYFITT